MFQARMGRFQLESKLKLPGSVAEETFQQPIRPSDDITVLMKGLQKPT